MGLSLSHLTKPIKETDSVIEANTINDDQWGATPFYATVSPSNGDIQNSEVVLVTSINGNTFSVQRGIKGTNPRSFSSGDLIYRAIYEGELAKIGDIVITLGDEPGRGRLFMNGGTYNRSDYPLLWEYVKNNSGYGTVASSTFTLKDMRQRFPLGKALAGTGQRIGEVGGQIDHKHSMTTVPGTQTGFGTGDVRAAIGATHDDAKRIGYTAVAAAMPDGGNIPNYKYSINSRDSQENSGNRWNHFTAVYGYTNSNNPPYIAVNFEVVAG